MATGIRDQGSEIRDPGSGLGLGFAARGQTPPGAGPPETPTPTPLDRVLEALRAAGCPLGQTWDPSAVAALAECEGPERLVAVVELARTGVPPKQFRGDVLFGRLWPSLAARLPPPEPPLAANPVARRHCPRCGTEADVAMNPYLVDDAAPADTPVWVLAAHDCGPTGEVAVATRAEAVAHEARRRAALGETSWRP